MEVGVVEMEVVTVEEGSVVEMVAVEEATVEGMVEVYLVVGWVGSVVDLVVVGSVVVEWGLQHGPIRVIPYTILPHVGPAQMDWTQEEVVVVVRGHSLLDRWLHWREATP